jgi:hypothetical protein
MEDDMRKFFLAALVAVGVSLPPNGASAALLSGPAALANEAPAGFEQVHWRGYRHCHPRRGFCHGPRRAWRRYWGPPVAYAAPPVVVARPFWGPRWRHRHWW